MVELAKDAINRLAGKNGLRFGKLAEYFVGSWAPRSADSLDDHGTKREAFCVAKGVCVKMASFKILI